MTPAPSIVVIGGGPRGTGVIERIAASAVELYGDRPLDLHVVDPHPAGGGRIWRPDQSPLLWMNSMAEDVTMFTDETVELAGPVVAGPALDAWAEDVRAGRITPDADPAVLAEIHGLAGADFPTRRLQSAYLRWTYERALAALPPGITVHEHRTTALAVTGPRGGRQRVRLQGRPEPLLADLVILTVGHLDAEQDPEQRELADFARRHALVHLPPDFTADSDLDALRPGEPVIVRGFGLAFVDLMVLLTEGRGGRYENGEYLPSGREPVLYVGSRRGVPYHAKIGYAWTGERPPLPQHLGPAWTEELLSRTGPLDFRRDIWPAVAKELGHAHYHRLFTAHPERTALAHEVFAEKYAAADPGSPELAGLIAEAVPDPADRLDLDALDRPLDGVRHDSPEAFQEALRAYITDDLARRHDPEHSEDLAVFLGLLSAYAQLIRLGDIGSWWHGFFSYLASGPPGPRLQQLLALSRAGVVRFLGADLTVETDEEQGLFRARSATVPGARTEARALVEARLPDPSLRHTASPLLRALRDGGAAVTDDGLLAVDPADGRVLDDEGRPHPRRFALGPFTTARSSGAFTRPRTGGPAFRQNDAAARAALTFLRDLSCRGRLAS
ncbi:FAD/NAD(P)-binding protein [Streptomyces sp. MBT56]|uniref:FAD/NAD(P)-binding protein n=1 Tax=unclassified Streptomyces TaxID=2593676 RepID=UPI00190E1346|nr:MULTISPECIES: FAD/NAD(P)-binding protein [unclassified Streptomyces]MBK3555160.1 FAD/NAD(P)-binding protein [Streptomyces sp. MBT56]MBK3603089.1 FAD/NAD(P)-binding protein [Streptomyces sp. MBT54]MBK3617655.1 FAD/NAD(P)-binding protein [Streptomyces sp. MBT98]MBK6043224.1 FAD/NAD(P)-binding protein [Streptomyces sp. MBT55]